MNVVIFAGNYEDAIEYVEIRRGQLPVAYNDRRALEAPFPDMSIPAPFDEEEEEEPLIDVLVENLPVDMLNDPLGVVNTDVKEEDLTVFRLDTDDRDEVNGLMDDIVNPENVNAPNTEENVSAVTADASEIGANSTEDDDEITCDAVEMPIPMTSMRHGMIKHENDHISGGLAFKLSVNTHI